MESAISLGAKRAASRPAATVRARELRAALEHALADADADERIGPMLRATKLRLRLSLTDVDLVLDLAAGQGDRNLEWSFARRPGWVPKLELTMTAKVANSYLQGRESLAIAIARGQVKVTGDSRAALLYLPAAQLICERYRRVVESDYPALAA